MIHENLKCYDNYEVFHDEKNQELYKKSKLEDSKCHIDFIKKIFFSKKLNVVELGSGNSKTLYNLSLNNLLDFGYGFEISKNRNLFAEKWKKELGIKNVKNILDNFLNLDKYEFNNIDLVFISDLAFQFCEPIEKNSDKKLLKQIYKILKEKGKLVIELDGCGKIINSLKNTDKIWQEFSEPDPWQFSLWDCKFDKKNKFLTWNKTFIHRNEFKKDYSSVVLKIYKKEIIEKLLLKIGFSNIQFYQDWFFNELKDDEKEFIIIAEK